MNSESIISNPTSMDMEILERAVREQFNSLQVLRFPDTYPIHFNDIGKLNLGFKNIRTIDNLWDFRSLTKLELNNNAIEKIQGLDHLINLTWLNLSFNSIDKIEGLESTLKLEVLNLSDNKISVIENMDTLENLTHFYISNNLIGELDNVIYLRRFKSLSAVSLFGNPFHKEDDYKFFIAAYFPKLMFLDSRLLDQKTKKEASIKYFNVLEEMRREELKLQEAAEAHRRHEAELKSHKEAFVESLNDSSLFRSMFKDDPEAETLHCVPGVDSLIQTFEHQMGQLCTQLFETGLAEHKQRETEVNSFFSGREEAVTDCQEKASQMLTTFNEEHRERTGELKQLSDPDVRKVEISHCSDEINQVCKRLMTLEFQLTMELEVMINTFDTSLSDMIGHFSQTAQGTFSQCRALEDDYYQKMQNIAAEFREKVANSTLTEDVPDDVIILFEARDAVMDALDTAHDNHLLKLNDREAQLITGLCAWKKNLINGIQDKELERNLRNISDIHRYMDYLREQLKKLV